LVHISGPVCTSQRKTANELQLMLIGCQWELKGESLGKGRFAIRLIKIEESA
jgi:hypothetical protein